MLDAWQAVLRRSPESGQKISVLDSITHTGPAGSSRVLLNASRVRMKKDPLGYDPQLIADLEKVKLDPLPNTAKIFRVDYFRLPDADVDKLFNYYYDSIALYGELPCTAVS